MDFITYTISAFIAFSGIFIGLLLAKTAPDEVHSFKKYIPSSQLILTIVSFLILFLYIDFLISGLVFILSFAFIFLFWQKRDINVLDYIVFSIIIVIASTNLTAHYYFTSVLFVFGVLSGSLFYVLHDKPTKKKILHHKHSGKQLTFNEMSLLLFRKYLFFFIFAIVNFIIAQIMLVLI